MRGTREKKELFWSLNFSTLLLALKQYPEAPDNSPVKMNSALLDTDSPKSLEFNQTVHTKFTKEGVDDDVCRGCSKVTKE